ncbi:MAG: D-alanine--D-alanine ligase, partial [Spirochaetota bacterium]
MRRLVILYGGKSGEHEVSLASAASILRHLDRHLFDPILIGIDLAGAWTLQSKDSLQRAIAGSGPLDVEAGPPVLVVPGGGAAGGLCYLGGDQLKSIACDAVFPVLHGSFGEDGIVQGLLECAGIPCVGAPVLGSALGMDKEKAKLIWMQAGLPV